MEFLITEKNKESIYKLRYKYEKPFHRRKLYELPFIIIGTIFCIYVAQDWIRGIDSGWAMLAVLAVSANWMIAWAIRVLSGKMYRCYVATNFNERLRIEEGMLIQERNLAINSDWFMDDPSHERFIDRTIISTIHDARYNPASKRIEFFGERYREGQPLWPSTKPMFKKIIFYDYYEPSLKTELEKNGVSFKEEDIDYNPEPDDIGDVFNP